MKSPDLSASEMSVRTEYINRLLGLSLKPAEICKLLEKMRYGCGVAGDKIIVKIPPYRTDVLHPIDVVEDVAIAFGYENFTSNAPSLYTPGSALPRRELEDKIRDVFIGFGFMEVKTLVLSNLDILFDRMNVKQKQLVEAEKPVSSEHGVARSWLMPSLFEVLLKNRNRTYPQQIFEVGPCVSESGKTGFKVAALNASVDANFADVKALASGVLENLGLGFDASAVRHDSFIEGRVAKTRFGFYGEISPKVLVNFKLEVPVTAVEFDVDAMLDA